MRLLPASATADAGRLLVTRGLRGLGDGLVSVLLADYLLRLGFSSREIGAIVTGTLLGSAALTVVTGLAAHRLALRPLLLAASVLMLGTGLGFAFLDSFAPMLLIAVVGTLNPSAGDVSVFLPTEQAALAGTVKGSDRIGLFGVYNLIGTLAGALGSLAAGVPDLIARNGFLSPLAAERTAFLAYSAIAVAVTPIYARLSSGVEAAPTSPTVPLKRSRAIVLRLAALFSLDALGGGFVVQSLLVLWLFRRFALSTATAAAIFFVFGLLGAFSQLISARIAGRIGLVRTMVFTHLPANVFLVVAGVMPTLPLAILFLALRASLSSMDVPARQSYVMSVVPPEERAAAAGVTNVPRSLASAVPPLITGWLIDKTSFGWPLLIAGGLKALYDVLLLVQFAKVHPPAEP
jgi:MFS family permease